MAARTMGTADSCVLVLDGTVRIGAADFTIADTDTVATEAAIVTTARNDLTTARTDVIIRGIGRSITGIPTMSLGRGIPTRRCTTTTHGGIGLWMWTLTFIIRRRSTATG